VSLFGFVVLKMLDLSQSLSFSLPFPQLFLQLGLERLVLEQLLWLRQW
jgi:hypothetical protein